MGWDEGYYYCRILDFLGSDDDDADLDIKRGVHFLCGWIGFYDGWMD